MTPTQPILIVGSMAFDDLELPTGSATDVVGGSATYSSFAASCFTDVRVVAVVGDDFPGGDAGGDARARHRHRGRRARLGPHLPLGGPLRRGPRPPHHARHPAQRLRRLPPEIPGGLSRARRSCSSATSTRSCSSTCSSQVERPRLVVADTMNFWIEGQPAALARCCDASTSWSSTTRRRAQLSGRHNIRRAARDILHARPQAAHHQARRARRVAVRRARGVRRAGLPARRRHRPDRRGRLVRRRLHRLPRRAARAHGARAATGDDPRHGRPRFASRRWARSAWPR